MAHIVPFKAVRPPAHMAHLVASRSFVTYKPADLKRKLSENPFTFIHIINPEFGQPVKTRPNSDRRFEKVKTRYEEFCNAGILVQDAVPAFYVYRQDTAEASFTGIICGVAVQEYLTGKIKIHEHTITEREETFCRYLDICGFNAEPVLLTFRENTAEVSALTASVSALRPDYDFSTTDAHRHRLWPVTDPKAVRKIQASFSKISDLYIADGHHRSASSALLSRKRAARTSGHLSSPADFILAMLIPADQLLIKPFHRLICCPEFCDEEQLLHNLREDFHVIGQEEAVIPEEKRTWGLRVKTGWYRLTLKNPFHGVKASEKLDAVIFTKKILEPQFGITDQKTDRRLQFIPGTADIKKYEDAIDSGKCTALFTLCKVDPDELFDVADAGEIMPPKSTWIAPKLRSGLTVMSLD